MGRFDPPAPPPEAPDLSEVLSSLLAELERLSHPTVTVPTPQVNVPAPNVEVPTEGMVRAISRAIREAVAALPEPPAPQVSLEGITADVDLTPLIEATQKQHEVMEALKEKISNIAGGRSHFDGRLRTRDGHVVDTSHPLPTVPATSTEETRLDYDARADGNPVYVGKAAQGLATSSSEWSVQKLVYDGSDRLTRVQVLTGAWDNRATLGWT